MKVHVRDQIDDPHQYLLSYQERELKWRDWFLGRERGRQGERGVLVCEYGVIQASQGHGSWDFSPMSLCVPTCFPMLVSFILVRRAG